MLTLWVLVITARLDRWWPHHSALPVTRHFYFHRKSIRKWRYHYPHLYPSVTAMLFVDVTIEVKMCHRVQIGQLKFKFRRRYFHYYHFLGNISIIDSESVTPFLFLFEKFNTTTDPPGIWPWPTPPTTLTWPAPRGKDAGTSTVIVSLSKGESPTALSGTACKEVGGGTAYFRGFYHFPKKRQKFDFHISSI